MNMKKYSKSGRNLIATLCATAAVAMVAPANSADLVGPDITVRYWTVAINSEQGAKDLLKRIEGAARLLCSGVDRGSLASRNNAQVCRQKVTADAVGKVNHPVLLAVYHSRGHVAPTVASLTK